MATETPAGITPFQHFTEILHQTKPEQMLTGSAAVTQVEAAREMHAYLVDHYSGVQAVHSFEDDNGSVFDCVPVELQPSLRA